MYIRTPYEVFARFKLVLIKYVLRYIWTSIVFKYIGSGEWLFKNYLMCVSQYSRTIASSLHRDIIRKRTWTFGLKSHTRSVPISVNENCSVYNYNWTICFLEAIRLFYKNPLCLSLVTLYTKRFCNWTVLVFFVSHRRTPAGTSVPRDRTKFLVYTNRDNI